MRGWTTGCSPVMPTRPFVWPTPSSARRPIWLRAPIASIRSGWATRPRWRRWSGRSTRRSTWRQARGCPASPNWPGSVLPGSARPRAWPRWHSPRSIAPWPPCWPAAASTTWLRISLMRMRNACSNPPELHLPSVSRGITMSHRVDYKSASPAAFKAMLGMETHVRHSGLEHALLELVELRVSQINGCAYCLDMHSKDARAAGETEQRLHVLAAWREAPFYSARERAALAWAEAVTLVATNDLPDALYDEVRAQFDDREMVDLSMAIITINGWNRLAIGFRAEVGSHEASSGT